LNDPNATRGRKCGTRLVDEMSEEQRLCDERAAEAERNEKARKTFARAQAVAKGAADRMPSYAGIPVGNPDSPPNIGMPNGG